MLKPKNVEVEKVELKKEIIRQLKNIKQDFKNIKNQFISSITVGKIISSVIIVITVVIYNLDLL